MKAMANYNMLSMLDIVKEASLLSRDEWIDTIIAECVNSGCTGDIYTPQAAGFLYDRFAQKDPSAFDGSDDNLSDWTHYWWFFASLDRMAYIFGDSVPQESFAVPGGGIICFAG